MTKPNYVTPAMVAAALHAVLLLGFNPDGPEVVCNEPPPRLVPICTLGSQPPEPPPVHDPDAQKVDEVKPLRGEPSPPVLAESAAPNPSDFRIATDEVKPVFATFTTHRLPPIVGVNDGDVNGERRWTNMPPIIGPDGLDRMPRARVQVAPDYPFSLKQTGVEGSVLVEFDVDASGQVIRARVLRSDRREFEEPTLRAVLKWRFEPGRRNGRAVPFRMQIPVDFHLNQD